MARGGQAQRKQTLFAEATHESDEEVLEGQQAIGGHGTTPTAGMWMNSNKFDTHSFSQQILFIKHKFSQQYWDLTPLTSHTVS